MNLNDILIYFSKNDTINNQNDPVNNQNDPVKISLTVKRKERLLQILLLILKNKELKRNDLIQKIQTTQIIIRRDIKILKDFDLIYYKGSDKYGSYRINNELQNFIDKQNFTL